MQDINTGNMVMVDERNKEFFVDKGLSDAEIGGFNPEAIVKKAESLGYCILSVGETVDIKGGEFKVKAIGKKKIEFECPKNIYSLNIKPQETITIKNGKFVIENYGAMFLFVRGVAGNRILDQRLIDEARKNEIEKLKETTKE
jgi:hypothetical protein